MAKQKIKYLVFALILITSLPVDVDSQQSDLVCGNSVQHRGFIIFGNSFQKGCYPWIVAMLTRKLGPLTFFCGGTLVSLKHVVTAAHCIKPKNGHPFAELKPHEVIAYFGAHDLNASNGTRITTSPVNISVHPDWDPNLQRFDADIAILVFGDGKIQYTKFIQPICLWISDDGLSETEGIVAGWGQSEDLTKPHESIPKQVTLKKIPNSDCFYDAPTLANIASNRTFCGGLSNGSGVCGGDSGNGFFILSKNLFYLDGIVSSSATTRTSCDVTKNAIYTDVSKFKSWINKTITETSSTREGTYCKLPNTTGLATCMLLHRCDSLFEYVKQAAYQPSNDQRAYVEQYTCGKKLVCCPDNIVLRRNLIRSDGVPEPTDLEALKNHPNYEAINDKKCGKVYSNRIIGGRQVQAGEFPWMALLQYKVGIDELLIFNCGGSLISVNFVLTAASCVNEDLVSVRLGQLVLSVSSTDQECAENPKDCDDPIQNIPVERRIVHSRYDPVKRINDVALLKLQSPANVKVQNVKTICLPTTAEVQYDKEFLDDADYRPMMLISGRPRVFLFNDISANIPSVGYGVKGKRSKFPLRHSASYKSTGDCADQLNEINYSVYASNFCASTDRLSEKCPGNKGGSIHSTAFVDDRSKTFIYGVLSQGVECENPNAYYPDVYTNVTYYLPWILDNMN